MLAKVYSAAVLGVDAFEVEIEVNAARGGEPVIVIVGLPDTAVKESKDRVTTAISNSGFRWPDTRCTVNLAPADVKKEGPSFDLPIALGMVAVTAKADAGAFSEYACVGELALTGAVRPVKGVLPITLEARRSGKRAILVPQSNAAEASVVEGIEVYGINDLREAFNLIFEGEGPQPMPRREILRPELTYDDIDFADVRGQQSVKRAIEIAVAGGHNILMIGPPGSGKSMLAKRIPTIMPPMTLAEAIDTTKIHSICGLLDSKKSFVTTRPFRSPHHTISDVGLLGGSANPNPGEVSLAHHGILFLDELPEFRRSTLEVMRQPIEDGKVTISRAAGTMTFPAEFMLVAAMNPCPCGYYGDRKRDCRCSTGQVERYRQRISGPLLDRIDIHIEVPAVEYKEIAAKEPGKSSEEMRKEVEQARRLQQTRFGKKSKTACNARMSSKLIKQHCELTEDSNELLRIAMADLNLSARAYDRILKVSRTIADMASAEAIGAEHLSEAIQYRTLDRNLWV